MMFVDDWARFKPNGIAEWMVKIAGKIGLGPDIPFHPIGGLKHIHSGYVSKDSPGPLGFGRTLRTDYGLFFYLQNLMLVGQALGVGGWIHGAVFPPYIYMRDEEKGWHGLGFRMQEVKNVKPMPPVPASQPNPVGIDGVLEGLTPPYVRDMDEAVDRVIEMKHGGTGGSYGDSEVFPKPYRDPSQAKQFDENAARFTPECIAYVKEIANYIWDTYGRFPAHVDAFYALLPLPALAGEHLVSCLT